MTTNGTEWHIEWRPLAGGGEGTGKGFVITASDGETGEPVKREHVSRSPDAAALLAFLTNKNGFVPGHPGGLPMTVVVDGGPETSSEAFRRDCGALGVTLRFAVGHPGTSSRCP